MRFTGTIEAKADTKGRVFFPAAFRRVLGDGEDERLVLAKDAFQPCLVVYPWSVWNAQVDELSGRLSPGTQPTARCSGSSCRMSRSLRSTPTADSLYPNATHRWPE